MKSIYRNLLLALMMVLVLGVTVYLCGALENKTDQNRQQLLEDAVKNCAVQCYALEGEYPRNLEYLEKNYTLQLNRDQYVYHYKFIGANMMPEISVFEKER